MNITVSAVNDQPVAVDDSASTTEDTALVIAAATLLGNDSDPDGDALTISSVQGAVNGTVSLAGGNVTFTPAPNYSGPASFTYTVSDGNGGTATATVNITVSAVNDAPTASPTPLTGTEDTALPLTWANFGVTDIDGPAAGLGVRITALPADGVLQYNNGVSWVAVTANQTISKVDIDAGRLRFMPDAHESGANVYGGAGTGNRQADYATFTFTATDGLANSASATMRIDITPVADAPTLTIGAVPPPSIATGQGLTLETWSNVWIQNNSAGSGIDQPGYMATLVASGVLPAPTSTATVTDVSRPGVSGVGVNTLLHYSGFIYLTAGTTYTFSGTTDDSLFVTVGGTHGALQGTWGANNGANILGTPFTPTQSGYYAFDAYAHNQSGDGNLNVLLNDGTGARALNSTNYRLYTNLADITNDGVRLSGLQSDGQGGYYYHGDPRNEGDRSEAIPLASIVAGLVDTDGSEVLSLTIAGIPAGATLSDGTNSYTNAGGAPTTSPNLSGWNLAALTLSVPAAGTYNLQVSATSTEQPSSPLSTASAATQTISVIVHDSVTPSYSFPGAPNGSGKNDTITGGATNDVIVGGDGNDTLSGAGGADVLVGHGGADTLVGGLGNDVLIGGAGSDVYRFDTTPHSTNNVDSISGFVPGSDTIELENSIFSGIGGSLSAAEFRAAAGATTATTAGQRIIYNTTTGDLYWDADGNAGGSAPVRFANLTNPDGSHPTLVNTNFIMI